MKKFQSVVCGGTFDLFHQGHRRFLAQAVELSKKLLIGITSDLYIQSFKDGLSIENFEIRKKVVEQFLDSIEAKDSVEIVVINSPYEPYLETTDKFKAIVVTPQTQKTALDINVKRKNNRIFELDVIVVPMVKAQDGEEISSTRIRSGEINRDGKLYFNPAWKDKDFHLPDKLRPILQEPFGEVLNQIPQELDYSKIITIGDITTNLFNQENMKHFLSIVDFAVKRQIKFNNLLELGFEKDYKSIIVNNPAGIITADLFKSVHSAFISKASQVVLVKGEEDLAVLPVLLTAPLGFSLFYGQPNSGLVWVKVSEENKEKAYQLLSGFDIN